MISILLSLAALICPLSYADEAANFLQINNMADAIEKDLKVPNIDVKDAIDLINSPEVVFVDVRDPDEIATSTIKGALSIKQFKEQQAELHEKKVIAFCTIGRRSSLYVEKLRAAGINAHNLRGSILAWTHAKGLIVDAKGQPTKRVHVFGPKWNLLPNGYTSVMK